MTVRIGGATRVYPIVGDPIAFVESPARLTATRQARGHDGVCVPLRVPADALPVVMAGLSASPNVGGVLVTMPHKFSAYALCSTSSMAADLLGVVSIVRRNHDGSWHGEMLDGVAFVKAQVDHGADPRGARALLLGAGGAGRAIGVALLEAGADHVVVCDADEARSAALLDLLTARWPGRASTGSSDPTGCRLVCNATPMGMSEDDPLPLDPVLLTRDMFVGDVIAGHGLTAFLAAAQSAGCRTANGGHMVEAAQEVMADFLLGA